jgi:hypothetical protein
MTFPHVDASASPALIKDLMQGIVANGEIYAEPPLTLAGAEFVSRTTTPVDLD